MDTVGDDNDQCCQALHIRMFRGSGFGGRPEESVSVEYSDYSVEHF